MAVTATHAAANVVDRSGRTPWQGADVARSVWIDFAVLAVAVTAGQVVRLDGVDHVELVLPSRGDFGYCFVTLGVVAAWMASLWARGERAVRTGAYGEGEYALVVSATLRLFGLIAIVSFLGRLEIARGYLAVAFPLGMIGLLVARRIRHNDQVTPAARG